MYAYDRFESRELNARVCLAFAVQQGNLITHPADAAADLQARRKEKNIAIDIYASGFTSQTRRTARFGSIARG